jgi:hypothetical protein
LEEINLCSGPRTVARHGACLKAGEDGVGVPADVVVRSEVEGELHRSAVALAEQGLDVRLEAHGLGHVGDHDCSFLLVMGSPANASSNVAAS